MGTEPTCRRWKAFCGWWNGKARRIWVMDRGIVSEENLAAIRQRGGQYLVGTPRRQMKRFEAELPKDDWTQGASGCGS
jgi:hypothetical protein